jgi:putative Mg2+ transporter-C (MgtC) family protein
VAVPEADLIWRLGLAFALSSVMGLEREFRQKSAGLRTHTLVGTGAALFTLVSGYGFGDVVTKGLIVLDPSRVAAQIVSGVGFLGAGLIFVQRNSVRGLTTAAGVWVCAAVGMASAANLPLLAVLTTVAYLIVSVAYPSITRRIPARAARQRLELTYEDGRGLLRQLLERICAGGFSVSDISVEHLESGARGDGSGRSVTIRLHVRGRGSVTDLAGEFEDIDGVRMVRAGGRNANES